MMTRVLSASMVVSASGCISIDDAHNRAKAGAVGNYCECTGTCHGKPSNYAGYRCDCSGLVSYAWKLGKPGLDTHGLAGECDKVSWEEIRQGDIILNPAQHVEFFQMWIDKKAGIMHTSACHDIAEGCNTKRQYKSYFEQSFYPCRAKKKWICGSEEELAMFDANSMSPLAGNVSVQNVHPASFLAKVWNAAADSHHEDHCHIAVAVALAESGGGCQAKNVNSGGSIDRGLWQINNYWHKEVSDSCAYDCRCNAKAAFKISDKGSNWHPWATYNSGAYKSHLSVATKACQASLEDVIAV